MKSGIAAMLIAVGLVNGIAWSSEEGHRQFGDLVWVTNEGDQQRRALVFTIERPDIKADQEEYALTGLVWHDDVSPEGYLEMQSVFPDGSTYFSRGVASLGPMRRLKGSSGPRVFRLPFRLKPNDPRPERLELYVVLPGKGNVKLGRIELGTPLPCGPTNGDGHWWSDRLGGLVGGIAGAMLGYWMTLIGILGALGRARRFVIGGLWATAVCGVVFGAVGLLALNLSQPYHVYLAPLLLGGLMVFLSVVLEPVMKRRYAQMELRKMSAMDAG